MIASPIVSGRALPYASVAERAVTVRCCRSRGSLAPWWPGLDAQGCFVTSPPCPLGYSLSRSAALGQVSPLERAAEALVEPVYPALERRMIETVKREIGPWVVGTFLGASLFFLWFVRATGKRVFV